MNNLTHKFATETGFSSIRIQKLMDKNIFPDEEFEKEKKKKSIRKQNIITKHKKVF